MKRLLCTIPVTLVLAASGLTVSPARARAVTIDVVDFSFVGGIRTVAQGTTVTWVFKSTFEHSTTSNQGFWNSPHKTSGTKSVVFNDAGRYPYHCMVHPDMTGRITVPVRATAITGGKRVQWSKAGSATRSYDVQIKRPGATTWAAFRTNTKALDKSFRPAKRGRYFFRARTHNLANGKVSGWSPAKEVRIA